MSSCARQSSSELGFALTCKTFPRERPFNYMSKLCENTQVKDKYKKHEIILHIEP